MEVEKKVQEIESNKTNKTNKTTPSGRAEEQENASKETIPRWPPLELQKYPTVANAVNQLTWQFFPLHPLIDLATSILMEQYGLNLEEGKKVAEYSVAAAIDYWRESSNNLDWPRYLRLAYQDQYPISPSEYWLNGKVVQRNYQNSQVNEDIVYTFEVQSYSPLPSIHNLLAQRIVPTLFRIETDPKGVPKIELTADVERFKHFEIDSVPKSNLFEVQCPTRPIWRSRTGWDTFKPNSLPILNLAATILCEKAMPNIMPEFINDLRQTFAWVNDGALSAYIGYLFQPMVAHLYVGQMPAYCFLGPTKAGKGYLSNALPAMLYSRSDSSCVLTKQVTPSSYEMEVLLNSGSDALYLCFDEIKNASDDEIKMIDSFCTQAKVWARKFRYGYLEIDNHFTLSMTAVNRTFTDETYGRLAVIKLNESRPELISAFHRKWWKRGPELLRAMFDAINKVDIDKDHLPKVPDRRPGFGLMLHILTQAFALTADYAVEASNSDILDDICKMHEQENHAGWEAGKWRKYSIRNFTDFMNQNYEIKYKRSNALVAINTALGYTSTKNHPKYKDTGYQAESSRYYDIEIREEGQKSSRTFIYVTENRQHYGTNKPTTVRS